MNIIVGAAEPVAEGLNSKLRSCPGVGRGKTGDQGVARGVKSQTDPLFKTGTIEIISQNIKKIYYSETVKLSFYSR